MPAEDPFNVETLRADPANPGFVVKRANVSAKIDKRRGQFIRLPWLWFEKLAGPPDGTKQSHGPTRELFKQCGSDHAQNFL